MAELGAFIAAGALLAHYWKRLIHGDPPPPAPMAPRSCDRTAKTVRLQQLIPSGLPGPEHFEVVASKAPTADEVPEGGILLRVDYFSADPYLRSGCKSEEKGGAVPRDMEGFVAGHVLCSRHPDWVAGDLFGGSLPFTTVQLLGPEALARRSLLWKLTGMLTPATLSHGIGALGMPGATAYGGLVDVLRPTKPGEVLWVSAAAGAVGSLVGQMAKNVHGLKTVGTCGGPAKVERLKRLGFDAAVDYKQAPDAESLAKAIEGASGGPKKISMYFDNVGGTHFEAAMATLAPHGRVAVCGSISHYNEREPKPDRFFPADMIYSFQRVEGFMCLPWLTGARGNFFADMARWVAEGKVVVEETRFTGAEAWPTAFQALFTGQNTGKVVVDVRDS